MKKLFRGMAIALMATVFVLSGCATLQNLMKPQCDRYMIDVRDGETIIPLTCLGESLEWNGETFKNVGELYLDSTIDPEVNTPLVIIFFDKTGDCKPETVGGYYYNIRGDDMWTFAHGSSDPNGVYEHIQALQKEKNLDEFKTLSCFSLN